MNALEQFKNMMRGIAKVETTWIILLKSSASIKSTAENNFEKRLVAGGLVLYTCR